MKAIERIAMYLQFRSTTPYSFERKIQLSNGYLSKQLRNLGSVGTDILFKIYEQYPELNILWVITGEGEMILPEAVENESIPVSSELNEFTFQYELSNSKLKSLESELERLQIFIKDKDKIIGLYEFMLNNKHFTNAIT